MPPAEIYSPGLEGVIAGETAVSAVTQDSLAYRGYMIDDLAEHASFEEVAYLLLNGELPNAAQLARFRSELDGFRKLPAPVVDTLRAIPPHVGGMEMLRTAISMAGHFDPVSGDDLASLIRRATFLLAVTPTIIGARVRLLAGHEPLEPQTGLSHAAQLLHLCFGRAPTFLHEKIMNLTLILYAEHEFNASTFAARVVTSTLSDMTSAVVAGVAALKGPLHGGANEDTIRMMRRFHSGADARAWAEDAVANKVKISGFGHRVYKNGDHRAHILEACIPQLAAGRDDSFLVDVYHAIKNVVWEKKKIHMNVDYPCGLVYHYMGLPIDIYTPIFVASRISGWTAHVIEQFTGNRIIRPLSRYTGEPMRKFVPVNDRR